MTAYQDIYFLLLYFFVYGFLGWCTEVAFAAFKERRFVNRGFLNGPICPIYGVGVTIVIALLTPYRSNLVLLYVASVILVTVLEGLTGWAMDKIFHNKWWDYSDMPLNIGGYVCLLFSLIWGVACVLIMDFIHPVIYDILTLLPKVVGIVLIVIFGIIMFADLYVTASAIFKFNRHLAGMDKIAKELHDISDQIGYEIYEKTIFAMEKQEESQKALEASKKKLDATASELRSLTQDTASDLKERMQGAASGLAEKTSDMLDLPKDISEDLRIRIAELRSRYKELERPNIVTGRLTKAFPKMKPGNHKEQWEEWKRHFEKFSRK